MRRAVVLLVACAAAGCEGTSTSAPMVDVPAARNRVKPSSSSTSNETAPAVPVSVAQLVDEGRYWRLSTKRGPVHVWVPAGYRPRRAETVLYVHGFYTKVDAAWRNHRLPAQFAASAVNAMFIACESPSQGGEPVSWESLAELLTTVEAAIGAEVTMPKGRVVALGHSGAWRTLLHWLPDPQLDTVVLFDAVYGEIETYRDWVRASESHRLINVGDDTKRWADELHKQLPGTLVLDGFPSPEERIPREVKRAQIVYIRSNVGHMPLVTGGIALPLTLRTLRGKLLLDMPLSDLLSADAD